MSPPPLRAAPSAPAHWAMTSGGRASVPASALGVHSVLSIPLIPPDAVVGGMNIYAHQADAFHEGAARIGELFAVPAAIAVQDAQVLAARHCRRAAPGARPGPMLARC